MKKIVKRYRVVRSQNTSETHAQLKIEEKVKSKEMEEYISYYELFKSFSK